MSVVSPSQIRFNEEDAIVLDRWIDDVCNDELQLPAHRRAHFAAYKQHLGQLRAAGGQSLFRNSSRSGTREILALQNALTVLRQLTKNDLREMATVREEMEAVESMLREKTIKLEEGREHVTTSLTSSSSLAAPGGSSCSGGDAVTAPEEKNDSQNSYEARRKLADHYVAEVDRQRQSNRENLVSCRAQHSRLLDERDQLRKEMEALRETEKCVLSRYDAVKESLTSEREALALERAAWDKLQNSSSFSFSSSSSPDAGELEEKNGETEEENNNNNNNRKRITEVRLAINEANKELAQTRSDLCSQDSSHVVRFRKARQRLKDWQGMVEHMRHTHDQLYARTRVIATVVETTATGLEAENRLGYMEQLQKLNHLLLDKSAKILGLRHDKGGENGGASRSRSNSSSSSTGPAVRELFSHNRRRASSSVSMAEAASPLSPPVRRRSSVSSTATNAFLSPDVSSLPSVGDTGSPGPHQQSLTKNQRQRQQYSLLSYLRRWEMSLVKESAVFAEICDRGILSTSAPTPRSSLLHASIQELRNLLFPTT